jgi:hypothetical protein
MSDPIVAKVREILLQRSELGIAKYGTTLAREDLDQKEWLVHLRNELLDGALYCQKLLSIYDSGEVG